MQHMYLTCDGFKSQFRCIWTVANYHYSRATNIQCASQNFTIGCATHKQINEQKHAFDHFERNSLDISKVFKKNWTQLVKFVLIECGREFELFQDHMKLPRGLAIENWIFMQMWLHRIHFNVWEYNFIQILAKPLGPWSILVLISFRSARVWSEWAAAEKWFSFSILFSV